MKKTLQILLVTLLIVFCKNSYAQQSTFFNYKQAAAEGKMTFDEIVNHGRSEIANLKATAQATRFGKTNEQLRELESRFERWVYNNKNRVLTNGKLAASNLGWKNYIAQNPREIRTQNRKSRSSVSWTNFSPYTTPSDTTYANGWSYGYGVGRINVVRQHPTNKNIFFAGSAAGGVFKSTDYCQTWVPTTDQFAGLGVSDLVIHPTTPNTMFLATGDFDGQNIQSTGIFKSIDGGNTWSLSYNVGTLGNGEFIAHVVFDKFNSNILWATTNTSVMQSTDGGSTWNSSLGFSGNAGMNDIVQTSANNLYVSLKSGGVYYTTDGGTNWNNLALGASKNGQRIDLAYDPVNTNTIYVLAQDNPAFNTINTTTNTLGTWAAISTTAAVSDPNLYAYNSQQGYNQTITVNPLNGNEVIIGEFNGKVTTNGGTSFIDLFNGYYDPNYSNTNWGGFYVHSDYHFIEFIPGTDTILIGNDGGVYIGKLSTPSSITQRFNGLVATQSYSMAIAQSDKEVFLMGNQDNDGFSRSNSGGNKWFMAQAGDGTATAISNTNTDIRYLGGTQGSLSKTTNGHKTNFQGTSVQPTGATASFVFPVEMHPNSNYLYAGYGELRKMDMSNDTWSILFDPPGNVDQIELANAGATTQKIYVINSQGQAYRSADESNTTALNFPTGVNSFAGLSCSKANWDSIFCVAPGYNAGDKVFMSTNGGSTWTNISANMPNVLMKNIKWYQNTDTLFVGTEVGLFYKTISGASWQKYGTGLPNVIISDIEINYTDKRLYVATFGRGAWFIDLQNTPLPLSDITFQATPTGKNGNEYNIFWQWNDIRIKEVVLEKSQNGSDFEKYYSHQNDYNKNYETKINMESSKLNLRLKGINADGQASYSNVLVLLGSDENGRITVYPNPVRDRLFVLSTNILTEVRIFDALGRQIMYSRPGASSYSISTAMLPNGSYFIHTNDDKGKEKSTKLQVSH